MGVCGRYSSSHGMLVSFDEPTDHIEASGVWPVDGLSILALTDNGRYLTSGVVDPYICPRLDGGYCSGSVSITNGPRKHRLFPLLAGGLTWSSVDSLTYSVPEPESIYLMAVGLLALLIRRLLA